MIYRKKIFASLAFSSVTSFGSDSAQSHPFRLITLIAPFAPGGSADIFYRNLADAAGRRLGVSAVVKNAGAGGALGALALADARSDGYTTPRLPLATFHIALNQGLA